MKEQEAGFHVLDAFPRIKRVSTLLVLASVLTFGVLVAPSNSALGSPDQPLYIVELIADEGPSAIHEAEIAEDGRWCPEHHLSSSCAGCPLCYVAVSSSLASLSGASGLWLPVRASALREAVASERFRPPTVSHL